MRERETERKRDDVLSNKITLTGSKFEAMSHMFKSVARLFF